jgi:hypothetical protein
VFTVHILLTIIRASVVYTMASKQVRKQRQHSTSFSYHSCVPVIGQPPMVDSDCRFLCWRLHMESHSVTGF